MKTRRAAAKRFRVTPTGKVAYVHSGLRHNLEQKSAKRKRAIARPGTLAPSAAADAKRIIGGV
jgi:large subunit ribosomal protein L35